MQLATSRSAWKLYALTVALSLLTSIAVGTLIPRYIPRVHDEFSYLLAGQTFAHFDLTNPTPPLWRFFESHHVLMEPSMMSKYPPGQGLVLAVGYWLGRPIIGVWLSGALWAASFTWLLRGFFSARWALLGGVLAIAQFGLTHYWVQTFWGGALAAAGGALVFGGSRRLWRSPRPRDAALFGVGVIMLTLTRPFEGLLACAVPFTVVGLRLARRADRAAFLRILAPGAALIAAGLLFLAYYNFRVTGSPFRLPYLEYEHRYAGTPYFIWQQPRPGPAFQNAALADYYHDYMVPLSRFYGPPLQVWGERILLTARNLLGPLLAVIALAGLALRPRGWSLVALGSLGVCALAMILSYWFSSHYQSVAVALYLFLVVAGVRGLFLRLPRRSRAFLPAVLLLLIGQGFLLYRDPGVERDLRVYTEPSRRQKIIDSLTATGERHLVFVRPEKPYALHLSWVFNDAHFATAPVLWAWDRGPAENRLLLAQYPDRRALLMHLSDRAIDFTPVAAASPSTP
ncbi:MAG: hypothetical protein H7343_21535 [Undibacterium sp.]|nr:hypothetical protein [Opitutaceae bacterium]